MSYANSLCRLIELVTSQKRPDIVWTIQVKGDADTVWVRGVKAGRDAEATLNAVEVNAACGRGNFDAIARPLDGIAKAVDG